jgi:hypothetical protein
MANAEHGNRRSHNRECRFKSSECLHFLVNLTDVFIETLGDFYSRII